jgi:hypothetical protein
MSDLLDTLQSISRSLSEIADAASRYGESKKLPLKKGWVAYGTIGKTEHAIGRVEDVDYYGARFTFWDAAIGGFLSNDIFVPWGQLGHLELATDRDDADYCILKWLVRCGAMSPEKAADTMRRIEDEASGVPVEMR